MTEVMVAKRNSDMTGLEGAAALLGPRAGAGRKGRQ